MTAEGTQGQTPAPQTPAVKDPKRVVTGKARLAYANIFKPRANSNEPNKEPFYSCTLIFEAGTDPMPYRKAAYAAATEKWGNAIPKTQKYPPIRPNSDKEDNEGFSPGRFSINCKSKTRPGVIDQAKRKITDPEQLYSGCWVRASIRAWAYENSGNKGVSFWLSNIQKMNDGEHLDGRLPPEQEFDTLPGGESDDPFSGGQGPGGPLDDDIPF